MEKRGLFAFVLLVFTVIGLTVLVASGALSTRGPQLLTPSSFVLRLAFVLVLASVLWSLWTFWGKRPLNPSEERTD